MIVFAVLISELFRPYLAFQNAMLAIKNPISGTITFLTVNFSYLEVKF